VVERRNTIPILSNVLLKAEGATLDMKATDLDLEITEATPAMIEQADLGVIIPNPAHSGIPTCEGEATGRIVRAEAAGPEGWNQVIMSLLDRAENNRS
jgi:hypothetical protein